jgi:hypothetical protein
MENEVRFVRCGAQSARSANIVSALRAFETEENLVSGCLKLMRIDKEDTSE